MAKTNFNNIIDFKLIISGLLLFIIMILITFGLPGLQPFFVHKTLTPTPTPLYTLTDPNKLTKEKIDEVKARPPINVNIPYEQVVTILGTPISTPVFVTNPGKLTEYLASTAQSIQVQGTVKSAYLYIKTGDLDIQNESVYFYIIDGKSFGGHFLPTESLIPDSGNEFLYDMSKLPLVQMPYSLKSTPNYSNAIKEMLNHITDYNKRKYYIGSFVSTTKLPNQVERIEIRYSCDPTDLCQITHL